MSAPPVESAAGEALPPVDARLAQAVREPTTRAWATTVVQHALLALADMQRLDESLYERFKEGEGHVRKDEASDALVRRLARDTFRGLRALVGLLRRLAPNQETSGTGEADLDFGDLEAPAAAPSAALDLEAGDIGELLDGLGEQRPRGEAERAHEVRSHLASLVYGLGSQVEELDERLPVALAAGEVAEAVELLDDTANAAGEGVFAVVATVYRAFLPEVDAARAVPGYLTTLDRALVVRRGRAALLRAVGPLNEALQDEGAPAARRDEALVDLRAALRQYVRSEACRTMRPADRWQLTSFERSLAVQSGRLAAQTSEGLAKYLESLGAINHREVLVLHDQRVAAELREAVEAARQLGLIQPRLAVEPAQKALTAALALFGRDEGTDAVLRALQEDPPDLQTLDGLERSLSACERLLGQ